MAIEKKVALMRLAMLTYSTRPRGGVVHALKLAERLGALGVDVTVHSLARTDDAQGAYFRQISVPFNIYRYEWHPDMITRLERMIESYANNLPTDADVYHAQDCVGGTALARMKASGSIRAPVLRTVHHVDDFAEPQLLEFEKRAVALADHRFVVSQYWRDELMKTYGFDSVVSYNGIDLEEFADLPPRSSSVPTILFVGGLEPRKGLEFLVKALAFVKAEVSGARLIAVAKTGFRGTDEVGTFRRLAENLGVIDSIEFHESVSQRKLLSFYSDCDVLVLPSRNEGWGLSLMEAMACGKPVVASRVGGVPELVRNGVDGILVEAADVRGLADAIIRLLRDKGLRKRMGRAGRERVKGYSWDATAKVVLETYESVLAQV